MPRRRKLFPCGHRGYGKECHACQQEKKIQDERQAQRDAWQHRLSTSPVDLSRIPRRVAEDALEAIGKIQRGVSFAELKGKRLSQSGMREVVRIPLREEYRLVLREASGRIRFLEVLSHEAYSAKLAIKGWK